jgi:hypothetical protein
MSERERELNMLAYKPSAPLANGGFAAVIPVRLPAGVGRQRQFPVNFAENVGVGLVSTRSCL